MGCSTSQGAKVLSAETKENGINEKAEGDRKYRKYSSTSFFLKVHFSLSDTLLSLISSLCFLPFVFNFEITATKSHRYILAITSSKHHFCNNYA